MAVKGNSTIGSNLFSHIATGPTLCSQMINGAIKLWWACHDFNTKSLNPSIPIASKKKKKKELSSQTNHMDPSGKEVETKVVCEKK